MSAAPSQKVSESLESPKPKEVKTKFEPQPFARRDSTEKKKKALEFLDDEIKNFSKKQIQSFSLESKKDKKASPTKAAWSEDSPALSGDLDFNDLEISFDKK